MTARLWQVTNKTLNLKYISSSIVKAMTSALNERDTGKDSLTCTTVKLDVRGRA